MVQKDMIENTTVNINDELIRQEFYDAFCHRSEKQKERYDHIQGVIQNMVDAVAVIKKALSDDCFGDDFVDRLDDSEKDNQYRSEVGECLLPESVENSIDLVSVRRSATWWYVNILGQYKALRDIASDLKDVIKQIEDCSLVKREGVGISEIESRERTRRMLKENKEKEDVK